MNSKKAKALRRGIGFHPAAPRQYEGEATIYRPFKTVDGKKTVVRTTGTIRSTGARQQYQKAKRTPGLAARLLGGA